MVGGSLIFIVPACAGVLLQLRLGFPLVFHPWSGPLFILSAFPQQWAMFCTAGLPRQCFTTQVIIATQAFGGISPLRHATQAVGWGRAMVRQRSLMARFKRQLDWNLPFATKQREENGESVIENTMT